jgi:hypothetical protein
MMVIIMYENNTFQGAVTVWCHMLMIFCYCGASAYVVSRAFDICGCVKLILRLLLLFDEVCKIIELRKHGTVHVI